MFEQFNLKDDAFPVTPSGQLKTAWYGFSPLRTEFQALFDRSQSNRSRLCVLNRGRLGAGKTHAAKFFCEWASAVKPNGIYAGFVPLLLESPKQPQGAFVDFAQRLQETVGSDRMLEAAANLQMIQGRETLKNSLLGVGVSEDVAVAFSRISADNLLATRAFFSGGGTTRALESLGVARRIKSDRDYSSVIKGLLYLLINGKSGRDALLRRVVLWIDEMEDLVYFPTRYYLPFTQALREVIDGSRDDITVFLNFTFSEPAELNAIENVLGQAIMQRMNEHVIFKEPTASDLNEYLLALLADNRIRIDQSAPLQPFTEESLLQVCKLSAGRTPRFVNKLVDRLLRTGATSDEHCANGYLNDSFVKDNLDNMVLFLDDERA